MKKVTVALATIGFVVLLSTPIDAQPMGTAPVMAPAKPAATMAPVMRAVPKPRPKPMVNKPKPKVSKPKAAAKPTIVAMAPAVAPAAPVAAPPVMEAAMAPAPAIAAMTAPAATAPEQPKVAPAEKKDSKGSVIGGWILQVILYLLGVFLTAFIPIFTAWLYKKLKLTNLQHKDTVDAIMLKAAMFGIGKAEEAAHKLKDNPIDGAAKLDIAMKGANQYLRDSGLPEKGTEYLTALIEAQLGLTRKAESKPAVAAPEEKVEEKEEPKEEKPDK